MSFFFFRRVSKAYEHYQNQDAVVSTTLQENLTGVRVVKAFARQDHEMNKFEGDNFEKFKRGKKLLIMHSLFWPSADILSAVQMMAGYIIGALMVMNGTLLLGDYVTYMGLVVLLIWPMRELGRQIVQASMGMVSFGRLAEIIRTTREPIEDGTFIPPSNYRLRGDIEFEHMNFKYVPESPVLHDISFHAEQGQVIALMGPTGRAKHRWSMCCRGSMTMIRQHSTRWRRAQRIPAAIICGATSASWSRNRSCSRARFAKTLRTGWDAR